MRFKIIVLIINGFRTLIELKNKNVTLKERNYDYYKK